MSLREEHSILEKVVGIGYIAYTCLRVVGSMIVYPFTEGARQDRDRAKVYRQEEMARYQDNLKIWKNVWEIKKDIKRRKRKELDLKDRC